MSEQFQWIYRDHKTETVIFVCDGNLTLSEADKLYRDVKGRDPAKQDNIGTTNTKWRRNLEIFSRLKLS